MAPCQNCSKIHEKQLAVYVPQLSATRLSSSDTKKDLWSACVAQKPAIEIISICTHHVNITLLLITMLRRAELYLSSKLPLCRIMGRIIFADNESIGSVIYEHRVCFIHNGKVERALDCLQRVWKSSLNFDKRQKQAFRCRFSLIHFWKCVENFCFDLTSQIKKIIMKKSAYLMRNNIQELQY